LPVTFINESIFIYKMNYFKKSILSTIILALGISSVPTSTYPSPHKNDPSTDQLSINPALNLRPNPYVSHSLEKIISFDYDGLKEKTQEERGKFLQRYQQARGFERIRVIRQAEKYLAQQIIDHYIPAWYGVPWNIVGGKEDDETKKQFWARAAIIRKSQKIEDPNHPQVQTNCSLFLTTTLKHTGVKVARYKLAQQLSADIIRSLVPKKNIRWLGNRPLNKFIADAKSMGQGLYIIGLDNHTGYLVNGTPKSQTGQRLPPDLYFCHADYGNTPQIVRCEKASVSPTLAGSKCKVIGKIFSLDNQKTNPNLVQKWLYQKRISTVGNY